jgi:hypothetical protein
MSAEPTSLDQALDRDIQLASGISVAVVTLFARVIQEMDAAGIVSKESFADQLEREVRQAQEDRPPYQGTTDLVVFRRLAKALRDAPHASSVWDGAAKWGA